MKCRNFKHLSWEEEEPGKMFFGWCHKVLDSPDPDIERWCRGFERRTNADRIRAMDDEHLAKLFYSVYKRSCIDFVNQSGINAEIKFENSEASEAEFLKYLQSPAEEDI